MAKGPSTCSDSSKRSCVETTSFVNWSAAIAASTTAPRPAHWGARAASERSATETGVSASVLEPTRTSYVRGAGSLTARPSDRQRSDWSLQTDTPAMPGRPDNAIASDGSTSLFLALAVDALGRPGHRLEPLRGDRLAAVGADAVGAVVDALQGRVDRVEHPLLVVLDVEQALVVLLQVLERVLGPLALLEQPLAEVFEVERRGHDAPSSLRS